MMFPPPFLKGTETINFSFPSQYFLATMSSVLRRQRVASTICTSLEMTVTGSSRTNSTPGSEMTWGISSFFSIQLILQLLTTLFNFQLLLWFTSSKRPSTLQMLTQSGWSLEVLFFIYFIMSTYFGSLWTGLMRQSFRVSNLWLGLSLALSTKSAKGLRSMSWSMVVELRAQLLRYSKYILKKCTSFSTFSKMTLQWEQSLASSKMVTKKSSLRRRIWSMLMKRTSASSLLMILWLSRGVWQSDITMLRSLIQFYSVSSNYFIIILRLKKSFNNLFTRSRVCTPRTTLWIFTAASTAFPSSSSFIDYYYTLNLILNTTYQIIIPQPPYNLAFQPNTSLCLLCPSLQGMGLRTYQKEQGKRIYINILPFKSNKIPYLYQVEMINEADAEQDEVNFDDLQSNFFSQHQPQPQQDTAKNSLFAAQQNQYLANKIQQIFQRKNTTTISQSSNKSTSFSYQITREVLQKIKKYFDQYNKTRFLPSQTITFASIAQTLNIPLAEVTSLYEEYSQDPLFIGRINQDEDTNTVISLSDRRIDFVRELVQRKGYLSHNEILVEMSKVNYLHEYSAQGHKIPITREMIEHMIRYDNVFPKNFFNQDPISNRYRYARRYLELTDDKNADICFLGQFSFSSNSSLSSCPVTKRDTFVSYQPLKATSSAKKVKLGPKEEEEDRWGKNIQILAVISLNRMIHYELYSNIFAECNFFKTMMAIAQTIKNQNPTQYKKYLILQTNFFHSKQDLRRLQQQTNIKILFLPPQTPMLNPTEYLFNQLRQQVKSKQYRHHRSLKGTVVQVLYKMGEKSMQSYYSCIRSYLQLSLLLKPFK